MKGIKITDSAKDHLKVATAFAKKPQIEVASEAMELVRVKYEQKKKWKIK